ncbi:MAG: arginyltransferase [Alphaproteobacteria bacterium]|nr:arginyltransferase [Alphaproteobacteria bacterium]
MFDGTTTPPLVFFHTLPMPCPYLPERIERRLVADISSRRGRSSHDALARAGFRRTQHLCYRPACPSCKACLPIRVRARDFEWTRSFRRTLNRNRDLTGSWQEARATPEQFALFKHYQTSRHAEGEMGLMDYVDFGDMIERSPIDSRLIEYQRDGDGALVGVMLVDVQDDGLSAVYSFFSADEPDRGLGSYMVLDLVRRALDQGLDYVYLGYWIAETRKMSYKARFKPAEVLLDTGWSDLVDRPDPAVGSLPSSD